MTNLILLFLWLSEPIPETIRGITVSCQGYGRVWGTDLFAQELDRLKAMGANDIAIHPYARIHGDGRVTWRSWPPGNPPEYIVRPIREAHRRGLRIMIKPHLAYWGSPFGWRGEIGFNDLGERARFQATYRSWILALAKIARDADYFAVGTELQKTLDAETAWRELITAVRAVTPAKLTYAANWDAIEKVKFWDALDFIGVQGYFPLTDLPDPDKATLRLAWEPIIEGLHAIHQRFDKPVIFTEFGYNRSLLAAAEPWRYEEHRLESADRLQARCLEVGLRVLSAERPWFHGVFLWKWFAGPTQGENFLLNEPRLAAVIQAVWLGTHP